jgi:D-hydroxyproline dehydrogenase subunit gamma
MSDSITVYVNSRPVTLPTGSTVAAAVALAGVQQFRRSVTGGPRAPLCGMGICFECRVSIDGRLHQRSCQTVCRPDMEIRTDDAQ